ncbi:MAG: hypothetical protein HQ553_06130 [Chloroflexi bacterium]|nr:hypothetical protein [Chloroflexota bacterium]
MLDPYVWLSAGLFKNEYSKVSGARQATTTGVDRKLRIVPGFVVELVRITIDNTEEGEECRLLM